MKDSRYIILFLSAHQTCRFLYLIDEKKFTGSQSLRKEWEDWMMAVY